MASRMLSISDSLTPIARTYPSTEALVQIAQHPGHDLGGADSTFELLPRDLLGGSVGILVQVAGQHPIRAEERVAQLLNLAALRWSMTCAGRDRGTAAAKPPKSAGAGNRRAATAPTASVCRPGSDGHPGL